MSDINTLGDQNNTEISSDIKTNAPHVVENIKPAENSNNITEAIVKNEVQLEENVQKENCVLNEEKKNVNAETEMHNAKPNEEVTGNKNTTLDQTNATTLPEANTIVENTKEQNEESQKAPEVERIQNENKNLTLKIQNLERDLQARTEERENFKNKVHVLESEIKELKSQQPNTLSQPQQNAVEKMKKQSEEILTRAKGVIFDKTKLIKHQELQIETLTLQITSLKEVLTITKELLEIRNLEVKELEEKMNYMEQKITAEKLRHEIMNKKMDTVMKMNTDLKTEYEIQLQLFNELRTQYAKRDELEKQGPSSS